MDPTIFYQFRDGVLSLDQARARLSATHFGVKYKVIDDFKPPVLNKSIYEASQSSENEKLFMRMYGSKNIENITVE